MILFCRDIITYFCKIIMALISLLQNKAGIPRFSVEKWKKKSETLVIFGTGTSINEINDDMFCRLAMFDTVGLNSFIMHDFIPDMYSVEYPASKEHFEKLFKKGYESKIDKFSGCTFLTTSQSITQLQTREKYDGILDYMVSRMPNLKFIDIVQLYPKTVQSMQFLLWYSKMKISDGLWPHIRGSLSLMIFFGLKMGYKNIVLAGIDLDNRGQFHGFSFDDKSVTLETHKTNRTVGKVLPIEAYIIFLAKKSGTKFYVMSKSSRLCGRLPLFKLD